MGFSRDLGDGLVLRSVRDEADIARYVEVNNLVGGPGEARAGERLIRHHPQARRDDFWMVEDTRTGQAVSTTCLIPWSCYYEDIPIQVAMLEMVVTHPDYRRLGLVRAQIQRFHEVAAERGFDLCIIQGIPHYYRQFGYTYALDHYGCDSLPVRFVPQLSAEGQSGGYRLRPATAEDIPALARLYGMEAARLQLGVRRDAAYWRYLMEHVGHTVRLLEQSEDGHPAGYTAGSGKRPNTEVQESAVESYPAALALLQALRSETEGELVIGWPETGTLLQVARSLGSKRLTPYQWLIRVPDMARWLTTIGPLLERRLANSACRGLTDELILNLYRQAYALCFQQGRLSQVRALGFVDASMRADGGDLCMPLDAFVRLVLGYRDLDTLRDAWPDIVCKPARRYLFDVLFPRMTSYVHMPY